MAVGKFGQLDLPELLAGPLVDGNAAPVDRADENLAPTDRDTAAVGRKQYLFGDRVELRLIPPDFYAGLRVERRHAVAGGNRVNHPVDHDRRLLDAHREVAALVYPGDFELADIGLVDLIERTVTPP